MNLLDISVTSQPRSPRAGFTNDPDKVVLLTSLAAQRGTGESPLAAVTVPLLAPEPTSAAATAAPASEPFLGEVVDDPVGNAIETPLLPAAVEGTIVDGGMACADGPPAAVSRGLEADAPAAVSRGLEADGAAAVSRGLEAYADVEQKARAKFPLSMSEALDQHKAAAEAARAAFEQALGASGGTSEAQEHKIALENEICRWRHPGKGAAVVEITDGIARLVKRDEAVGGCGAKLVSDNWEALSQRCNEVWKECYGPIAVSSCSSSCSFESVEAFDAAVETARQAAAAMMEGLEADLRVFLRMEEQREKILADRSAVLQWCSEQRLMAVCEKLRKDMEGQVQASKDSARRELKVVLDKAKGAEERVRQQEERLEATQKEHAQALQQVRQQQQEQQQQQQQQHQQQQQQQQQQQRQQQEQQQQQQQQQSPPTPPPAGAQEQAGKPADSKAVELLEKRFDKKLRDESLSAAAQVAKARAESAQLAATWEENLNNTVVAATRETEKVASKVEKVEKLVEEEVLVWQAKAQEELGQLQQRAEEASERVAEMARAQEAHVSKVQAAMEEHDKRVAENCRQMFTILEQRSVSKAAVSELRDTITKAVDTAIQGSSAELRAEIQVLQSSLHKTQAEMEGMGNKVTQAKDEIQALFGMIASLPNTEPAKKTKFLASLRSSPSDSKK